ncbi:hypothetical protein [Altererythrobacter sp. ZODW24]|uniref:tetratricopeptide repeat protein n=1 Tax=Altererythrobacter sp. ZODW24 TaxID=2185142 RepID=UPI000DF84A92|nr:hypothetical protein [Altererythrobacter sp. ZODW24]
MNLKFFRSASSKGQKHKGSWLKVAVCAIAALTASVTTAALTYRQTAQKTSPLIALWMSPGNAKANNVMAKLVLREGGLETDPKALASFSQRSIETLALNPEALSVAGIADTFAGKTDAAREKFRLSEKMSRRYGITSIWLFEDQIKAGNISEGLALLDRALRIQDSLQATVFPTLIPVISNPGAGAEIAPLLAEGSDWTQDFGAYAAVTPAAAPALAKLVEAHPESAVILDDTRRRQIVETLFTADEFALAGQMYDRFNGSKRSGLSFADRGDWRPFDWELGASGTLSVFDQSGRKGIEFTIDGGGEQLIASRMLTLSAGQYTFSARAAVQERDLAQLGLRVRLSCASQPSNRIAQFSWSSGTAQTLSTAFTVPSGCPLQAIEVISLGQRSSTSGSLSDLIIDPV